MYVSRVKSSLFERLVNRAKDVLFMKPLIPFWRHRLGGKAMVYLYHRIGEEGDQAFLDKGSSPVTSGAEFCKDIQTLKKLGAKFVTFSELANCDYASEHFYVVICADDGFLSNYQLGAQICQQEGVPQTIFQCSGMVATSDLIWEHQLYFLMFDSACCYEFREYLQRTTSWPNTCDGIRQVVHPKDIQSVIDQYLIDRAELKAHMQLMVKTLYPSIEHLQTADKNGIELASHGDSHFPRSSISDEEFEHELKNSKQTLQRMSGQPVTAYSHPFNSYTESDISICAPYYSQVATVNGGCVDNNTKIMSIPRNTFPGSARNTLRHRRWLLTGRI